MELANEILFPEVAALLEEGHTVTLKAKGTSMMPFIVGGRDSVVLQKADRVAVGDIVLARLDDRLGRGGQGGEPDGGRQHTLPRDMPQERPAGQGGADSAQRAHGGLLGSRGA